MYQVTIRGPDGSEIDYELGADMGLIFGRDETCDVVLPSKRVSRRHARFFTESDALFCEDLGSNNGVFVGGARIQGTQEIRPGPAIEIGEFHIRIKRIDDRALRAAAKVVKAHLRGVGDCAGQTLTLPPNGGCVGREPSCDVPIEDDSVSRQHAELIADTGGLYCVRDLGSSNGTFINGARLNPGVESPLNHNDRLRFGDTHWLFVGGAAAQAGAQSARARRLLGVSIALVVLVAAGLYARTVLLPSDDAVGGVTDDSSSVVFEAIGRGQAAADQDRFAEAARAFEEALMADPVNTEARLLLRRAQAEVEHSRLFDEARTKSELGNDADALSLYVQIDSSSRFFARARLRVQELAGVLVKKDGPECKKAGARKAWPEVMTVCSRYLNYSCHAHPDAEAEKYLRAAEQATKATQAWACPSELLPWFGEGAVTVNVDDKLKASYPDAALREAVVSYVKGDLAGAQRAASNLKSGNNGAQATEVYEAMVLVEGRFKEAQSALLRDSVREAGPPARIALDLDEKLLRGADVESFSGKQIRSALSKRHYEIGRESFDRTRWKNAFDAWAKGLEFSPNDGLLLDGMAKLEKIADRLAANGECADLTTALQITRPKTTTRLKIEEALAEQCR